MKKIVTITAALAFAAGFAATSAAASPAFMKLGDIKGEAAKARQHRPFAITREHRPHAMIGGHKHGTDQVSKAYGARSRVHVAAGDVNNDGARIEKGHARVRGGLNPANTVQAPQKDQGMNGLLLPAVQKAHAHKAKKGHIEHDWKVEPGAQQTEKGHARVRGGLNPANTVQAPKKDEKGLLLPAVQKAH